MNKYHNDLIEQHGATSIIESLEPYVTEQRKQRIDDVLDNRLSSIQIAIESPSDINNALATVRSCEALGIATTHIITPEGIAGSMRRLTQGAFYWSNIFFHSSLNEFLQYISKEKLLLAGAAVDGTTHLSEIPIKKPLCLIIGNEQRGLSKSAKNACDFLYRIPMVGMSESLNLSVSAAISLYDTSKRKRTHLKTNGDLPVEQSQHLRARYYMNSVNGRLIEGLIK